MQNKKTILVIDDEKDFAETIKMMLETVDEYEIIMAHDGKEGIKKACMAKPDLILLDITMPEMDGIQTLKLLKENDATVKIPVIMVTAHDEDVFKIKSAQLYNEDYITKPVETKVLLLKIEQVLKKR